MLTLRQKAENVLASVFCGLHHVEMERASEGLGWLTLVIRGPLSTYDFGELTRLVVAAHDECVRVQVEAAAYGYLRLMFHDRQREGHMFDRHPDMETALASARNAIGQMRVHKGDMCEQGEVLCK